MSAKAKLWASAALLLAARAGDARAQSPVTPVVSTKRAGLSPRGKAVVPAPAPAPAMRLAIDAPTTRGPWTMRLTNGGDVPLRVVADARMLVLEVTPRGAKKPVRCELPADMRPADDQESALVMPAERGYTESFEPRLYCFGPSLDALAPGAVVVARLGWPGRSAATPPYAVAPIDGVEPVVAARTSIDAAPIALPDEPTAQPVVDRVPRGNDEDIPALALAGSVSVDAAATEALEIPLTLRNESSHAVTLRFRPETISFDVVGPLGVESCQWATLPGAPLREVYTTLPPKTATSLSVMLPAYCSSRAFDQGGLFVVRPRLDTSHASGSAIGLPTFDGVVIATTPTVVRLHRGNVPPPLRRPRLDPR
jgi:hypothetical protein